jgi:hypothetical protein
VIAHQNKHPKGVGYVVAQKMSEMKKVFIHSWTFKIDPSNPNLDDHRLKSMNDCLRFKIKLESDSMK